MLVLSRQWSKFTKIQADLAAGSTGRLREKEQLGKQQELGQGALQGSSRLTPAALHTWAQVKSAERLVKMMAIKSMCIFFPVYKAPVPYIIPFDSYNNMEAEPKPQF